MGSLKIAVLGLGESLGTFEGGFDATIGVNDIWQRVQTDYVVCLDKRERFTPERLAVIDACTPRRFYTQVDEWQQRPDYVPITLQYDYPNYVCQLAPQPFPKSLCSPFVACAIAYKLHDAKEIHLFGVDLTNHPHLKDGSLEKIKRHFTNLQAALLPLGARIIVHGNGILKALNN